MTGFSQHPTETVYMRVNSKAEILQLIRNIINMSMTQEVVNTLNFILTF